jgi:hypothetical protein
MYLCIFTIFKYIYVSTYSTSVVNNPPPHPYLPLSPVLCRSEEEREEDEEGGGGGEEGRGSRRRRRRRKKRTT